MISIELFGNPIPKLRARFRRTGKFVQTYDPQAKLKEGFVWQVKSQYRSSPLCIPLIIEMRFYMPIPKATSKTKRLQMIAGEISHISRPDLDNLQKFALDCLSDVVFVDDSQVIQILARKMYGENPCTILNIRTVNEYKKDCFHENCS